MGADISPADIFIIFEDLDYLIVVRIVFVRFFFVLGKGDDHLMVVIGYDYFVSKASGGSGRLPLNA